VTDEELTLLIRTVANAGFIVVGAHKEHDDRFILAVKTPPPRT
jgi:hypothetical protein